MSFPMQISKRRVVICAVLIALHLGVFTLYTHSDFLVTVANQVWGCF